MPIILDGKALASTHRQKLAKQVQDHVKQGGQPPHLAIVLIGNDPASHTYVQHKIKACHEIGFQVSLFQEESMQEFDLLNLIEAINNKDSIDGVIVQLPLPAGIDSQRVIQSIKPEKDVDGLHPLNYGRMACNLPSHIPATPLGILLLLQHYQIAVQGKHCVIVGRGATIGSPLSILMSRQADFGNATVTLCHRYTHNLSDITRQADILIAAVGQPNLIQADMVQTGAVVIDVGITRISDATKKSGYRLQGDVAFEAIAPQCRYITPVPGGVGPMTIVALLHNTLRAALKQTYAIHPLL